jgi:hypothetical protein
MKGNKVAITQKVLAEIVISLYLSVQNIECMEHNLRAAGYCRYFPIFMVLEDCSYKQPT